MLAFDVRPPLPLRYRTLGRGDARDLEALHTACPLEVAGGLHLARGKDFFAWPNAVLHSPSYEGVFRGERLVASLATGVAHVAVDGAFVPALCLFDARVHPSERGQGLLETLSLRSVAARASSCSLALVVRRLDNHRAARCARMPAPVSGTESFALPLAVIVVPPADSAKNVREPSFPSCSLPARLLGRRGGDLVNRLWARVFETADGCAQAIVADPSWVRARVGAVTVPLDVRALAANSVGSAEDLLAGIAAATGRPLRVALGGEHALSARLQARGASMVACELRVIARQSLAHAFCDARSPFVLDASLL